MRLLDPGPVLVLGATGQLGGELITALRIRGAETVAADRERGDHHQGIDLSREHEIDDAVARLRPAVVINAAAYTAVDRAQAEAALAEQVNAQAPAAIARACRQAGALMVHFSTDYVFDGRAGRPYRESDPVSPLNEYGRSKARGERAVASSGADHLIFRTSWLYTPGGHNFVATMLRLFHGAAPVRVVDDQRASPTCARHLAHAVVALLERLDAREAAGVSGLYHLCAQGETSWYGFARAIHERALPTPTASLERTDTAAYAAPAPRPARSTLDCTLARDRLGLSLPSWLDQLEAVMPEFNAAWNDGAGAPPPP